MASEASSQAGVALHLVDPGRGDSIQVWRFDARKSITIGRSEDRDVVLADPRISRLHAELQDRGTEWWLVSHGRNGVLVDGRAITEMRLANGLAFQLGPKGPCLTFFNGSEVVGNMTTVAIDPQHVAFLQFDETKISEEVRQIAEGDYFQSLQKRACQLREKRFDP